MGIVKWEKAVQFIFSLKVVFVFCFWLRFLFVGQFLLRQSAIRTRIQSVPYDVRGQEEERGAPNLICGFSKLTHAQHRARAAPKRFDFSSWFYWRPSFSGVLRPVWSRHKSMASRRPTATIAFFLAAPVALGLASTGRHFCKGG